MTCDFCSSETENVYKHVHLCPRCGLVQSEPRSDRTISTSCEADQGNLRNGKAFRFPQSVPLLEAVDWAKVNAALDIGSNRGSFVRWMGEHHPDVKVTPIEPERRLVDYPGALVGRFEDFAPHLPPMDLVFSSHTLEHAQSADAMMRATARLMPIGSQMVLELPNLATITDPRAVEEFYIWKHNVHVSIPLLVPYLMDLGFWLEQTASTLFDIRFLLRKMSDPVPFRPRPLVADATRRWIEDYAAAMERNRAALPKVAARLHKLARTNRVAYWGAGRIFDALIRFGHLDTGSVDRLVDGMLQGVVAEVHGIPVDDPACLAAHRPPDVVVVLGRTSSDELAKRASQFAPTVLTFNDLLDEALA